MKIAIVTLFPEMFEPVLDTSILGRAQAKGLISYQLVNLRDYGQGVHKTVDDRPYGGGAGMVLRADILAGCVDQLKKTLPNSKVILTSASGQTFTQSQAQVFSKLGELIIICGHYEGVDQRFVDQYVDQEISIGDYVLTGGELPALVMVDAITRLIKGVLKKEQATVEESFSDNLLEYPHYTRPEKFNQQAVPQILKSGNHQQIANWRKTQALSKTKSVRPDLLKKST